MMSNNLAGYLIKTHAGYLGSRGPAYDYVLAGNGLFIEAANEHIAARMPVAKAGVRGLPPLEPRLRLLHGPVPAIIFQLALNAMLATPDKETYIAVAWDKWQERYVLHLPEQEKSGGRVKYTTVPDTILELHSHCGIKGCTFSGEDNRDEQGFKVYGVVCALDDPEPAFELRLGFYGYFRALRWGDVFSGLLQGAIDVFELLKKDEEYDLSAEKHKSE